MRTLGAFGRPRCEYCGRVIFWKEFLNQQAHWKADAFREFACHDYDCEHTKRRKN